MSRIILNYNFIPIIGDVKDGQEVITGRDLVTGKKLSNTDRMITAAAVVVPVVSGRTINTVKKAVKSPTIKKAVKSGTKKLKQSTEEIVKKVKSGIQKTGKEVVDSVKKEAKDKTEDVKKKAPTKEKEDVKIESGNSGEKVKKGGRKTNPVINNMESRVPNDEILAPIKRGIAPQSKIDGKPIEIHHNDQEPLGPFREMHTSKHRYGENYKNNHPNYNRKSRVDRTEFKKWKREYWENEWNNGRWD